MRIRCPTSSTYSTGSTSTRSVARKAREREHRKRQQEQQSRKRADAEVRQGYEQEDEYPATRRVRAEHASSFAYGGRRPAPTKQELRAAKIRQMEEEAAARRAAESSSPLKRGLQFIYNNIIPGFGFTDTASGTNGGDPQTPIQPTRKKTYFTPGAFPGMTIDSDSEEPASPPPATSDVEMEDETPPCSSSRTPPDTTSDSASFSSTTPSSSSGNRSSFYAFPSSSATSIEDLHDGRTDRCELDGQYGPHFCRDPREVPRSSRKRQDVAEDEIPAPEPKRKTKLEEEVPETREGTRERLRRKEREFPEQEAEERVRKKRRREQLEAWERLRYENDPFAPLYGEDDPFEAQRRERDRVWNSFTEKPQRKKEAMERERRRKEAMERERLRKEEEEREAWRKAEKLRREREESELRKTYNREYFERKWRSEGAAQARSHPYTRTPKTGRARCGLRFSPADPFEFPNAGTAAFKKRYGKPTAAAGSSPAASCSPSKPRSSAPAQPGPSVKKFSRDPTVYYEWYESAWSEINTLRTSSLSFPNIPWAVVPFPRSAEEVTSTNVKAFMKARSGANGNAPKRATPRERRAAAKKELLNWHSDKFATRVLQRVVDPAEREVVRRAADVVQKALTEYMREPEDAEA